MNQLLRNQAAAQCWMNAEVTLLAALGALSQVEHTGRVLHELVGLEARVTKGEPAVQIPGMSTGEKPSSVTDTAADEMEEHFRGLGYLE